MEKAIIYARVSTEMQEYNRQVVELSEYAKKEGYEIVETFAEKISGYKKNADRPKLTAALEYAKENSTPIFVWELSRLGRNADELHATVLELKRENVNTFFKKEKLSIFEEGQENHYFWVLISCLSACAEIERSNIRERMKSGYQYFRQQGGKVGRKEGYRKTIDDYRKQYPQLVQDLQDKAAGKAKGKAYSVRALAERYSLNPSTVQAISSLIR